MIADLEPYAVMRESGNQALGRVPAHWQVDPIARIGSLFKGRGGNKDDETSSGIPCVRYGDLYTRHEFFITATRSFVSAERAGAYTSIKRGDVLFAASGETIDDIGRSAVNLMPGNALCGGDLIVLRPTIEVNPRFLGYAADGPAARQQKAAMGRGFTVVHVYGSELKRLVLALPPLREQAAIVRFLDHADRRIRRYVRAKQQLIRLLEEQRQAIIHRASTRGLDPDVRLKPSGVEWFGDIPEHWEVRRAKSLCDAIVDCKNRTPDAVDGGGYAVVRTSCIRNGRFDISAGYETDATNFAQWTARGAPRLGDVFFTREAPAGEACLVPDLDSLCMGQRMMYLRPATERLDPEFLLLNIYGSFTKTYIDLVTNGSTVGHLRLGQVYRLPILWCGLEEQQTIVRYVKNLIGPIDVAREREGRTLELLKEFRARLVADVVTGKLDVRDAAARLPAELEPLGEDADQDLDEAEGDLDREMEAVER